MDLGVLRRAKKMALWQAVKSRVGWAHQQPYEARCTTVCHKRTPGQNAHGLCCQWHRVRNCVVTHTTARQSLGHSAFAMRCVDLLKPSTSGSMSLYICLVQQHWHLFAFQCCCTRQLWYNNCNFAPTANLMPFCSSTTQTQGERVFPS